MLMDVDPDDVRPDLFTFNAAISSCQKGAEWQWALEMFDVMRQSKITPDTISFNALISSFGCWWMGGFCLGFKGQ